MLIEKPLTGTIGAEIEGVDLNQPITPELADALRDALRRRQALFFRDQHLDIARQKAATEVFGPLFVGPYVKTMDEEPAVIRVLREADDKAGGVFGGGWHSDYSFLERPPRGTVLNAVEIPPYGGDTVWLSQVAAYQALPDALKAFLDGKLAYHVGKPYGVKWAPPMKERAGGGVEMSRGDPTADEERAHPAVAVDPVTGRRALFLNPTYVVRLEGLTEAESRPILQQIQEHSTRPEFCCRFRWSAGTLAVWDNHTTQHYAVNDYAGFRRLMHRTTFAGPPPQFAA